MSKKKKKTYKNIRKKRKAARPVRRILPLLLLILLAGGCYDYSENGNLDHTWYVAEQVLSGIESLPEKAEDLGDWADWAYDAVLGKEHQAASVEGLASIPEYSGDPYVVINQNVPDFTEDERSSGAFEYYSELDRLGRCGMAEAMVGLEIMPTEERGSIGQVKPTGWHTVKYDNVDGMYLYNRCHLIAYELSGENANEKNLITGTRYMNVEGMLPWENMVANYVKQTGDMVLYRVTPIYEGNNLVASGVHMEAESIGSDEIQFNIYVYNVQPGIGIDYSNGNSWKE